MWIISEKGLFNTDNIAVIKEEPMGTFAVSDARRFCISERKIKNAIADAIAYGTKIMEVE